ncbi:MAG: radical SAM family heme chaperone HemW [Planctomycetia bacterium]
MSTAADETVPATAAALPRAVYVHVPFCRHRCGYCDFSLVAGRDDLVADYLAAIDRELARLDTAAACRGKNHPRPLDLDTLYLGGGTPSHLGPTGLVQLFEILQTRLRPLPGAEVSMEANPGDVTAPLAAAAMDCGVTRVSLGVQSLDATTLAALDRDHAPDDVRRAVGILLAHGLTVNVDLMTAAPGQTLADVDRDLDAVVALGTQHVSVYCLTWEKGTQFDARRRRGLLEPTDESLERAMLERTIDRLTAAGFEHYEVSNFARPGGRCRHNETYWDCRPWEAFGPGAARVDGRERLTNHRSTPTWLRRVLTGEDGTGDREVMTPLDAARERVVLGLRRRDGLDRASFLAASGFALDAVAGGPIRRWTDRGLATDDGKHVRLTREGLLVSDALWADVL